MSGLSLTSLEMEKTELQRDLYAFKKAYDIIRKRLLELGESRPERVQVVEKWSGTWACIGSLDLSVTTIEKKILEVEDHIQKIKSGEIPNTDTDKPKSRGLGVIDGGIE